MNNNYNMPNEPMGNGMEMKGSQDMPNMEMDMNQNMKRNRTGVNTQRSEQVAQEVYSTLNDRMSKGISFHEQLADYFCFLGLQGFKRMLEYQYMKECAEKRKLHRRYIDTYHKVLPMKQVQLPMFIPSEWSRYKTSDIDDNTISKYVRSALQVYKQWEEETKQVYTEQCEILKENGMTSDYEFVKEMIVDVEKELKKINRLHDMLNGTGYDVNMIQGVQDKYHEKYKKKYHDRFTTKNNYVPYIPPYGDEEYKRMRTRRKIGF